MNIHEYQAKQILAKYGVKVAKGILATCKMEAEEAAEKIGGNIWVVKAQIHSGGRGKAGGVKIVKSPQEAGIETKEMIGKTLITPQTGAEGKVVHKVYIEEGTDIAQELYLSAVLDRDNEAVTFIASLEGGVEIEEIAHTNPEKIIKTFVKLGTGIQGYNIRQLTFGLGLEGEIAKQFGKLLVSVYEAFIDTDASQLEINPLVITKQGYLVTLDAKMNFDDNALYRQAEIVAMRDELEEEALELKASKHDLNYIKMDGSIGCMVNGAGLAMATMDIIKLYGSSPANFLDVGGGATKERVTEAFKIIVSDENVKGILVNIFGGIMRCDIIAEGIVEAAKTLNLQIPLVVRLEGTNVELGKQILADSGLTIIPADDLADGAEKIVGATVGAKK